MRSKFFLIFLVLYLSWTISLVDSATKLRVPSASSEEDDGGRGVRLALGEVEDPRAHLRASSSSVSRKEHGRRVDHKLRHFREASDYDRFYSEAFRTYEGGPSSAPVQLVDQHGNFMTVPRKVGALEGEGAEDRRAQGDLVKLMAALNGIAGKGYLVVSVFGHQSTGKSFLMNQVFGTDFSIKGSGVRDQWTRGVWLAHSPELPQLLIVDCEGTGGAEKLRHKDRETVIAEYGMVYSMLVSQLVIFNLDYVHMNSAEHEVMFTNTLEHYMKNKAPNSPALRIIVTIRNVPNDAILARLEEYAKGIVTGAFEKNKKGDDRLETFFDVHYFWFGYFNVKTPLLTAEAMGYEGPDFFEEEIGPLFTHRLALFKRRFTAPEARGYYLGGLAPLMPVTQLPSFLHQFWDLIDSQEVGLENPLMLTIRNRLVEAVGHYAGGYEHKFRQLIATQADKAPEVAAGALRELTEPVEKEYSVVLEGMVPSYAAPVAEEYTEKLLVAIRAINERLTPSLMKAMADHAAGTLPAQARHLIDQNTHAKELEAIGLFRTRQQAIQALCPLCPPQDWAGALQLAEQDIAHAAARKQEARVDGLIQAGLDTVHGGDGDLVAGVARLAQTIAGPEGLPLKEVKTKVATEYHRLIPHFSSRRARVKDIFDRLYSLGQHIAGGKEYLDPILAQARARKDQLVAFRQKYNGRVGFHQSEATWRDELEDFINDFERVNTGLRDHEVAKMEASYKESSLRYALGFLMLYQVVTDYSLTLFMFWTFIFFLAMSGMLGPQILDPARWIALPGYIATSVGYLITAITAAYQMGLPVLRAAGLGALQVEGRVKEE